jgi:hypothetical protein
MMSSGTYGAGLVPLIRLLMVAAGLPRIDDVRMIRWPRRWAWRTLEAESGKNRFIIFNFQGKNEPFLFHNY